MQVILEGKLLTPLVTRKTTFIISGCKAELKKGTIRRRYYSKINSGKPMFPYSLICFLGIVRLKFQCRTKVQGLKRLQNLISIEQLGRFQSEGLGQIKWLGGQFEQSETESYLSRRLKIRNGLPQYLPQHVLNLIKYGILHDFFHNSKHKSKIYVEPPLQDQEFIKLLKDHHNNQFNSKLVQAFQHYDRLASRITRKVKSPKVNRYNWKSTKKINFNQLAKQISEVSENVWKLYQFIYQSQELDMLNESFLYGHTSLRQHLLIISNLIVFDYLNHQLRDF